MSPMNSAAWIPAVTLDLDEASNAGLMSTLNEFKAKFADVPLSPLDLIDGWNVITPQIAENLLRRNAGNRKVSLQHVAYCARQMKTGQWMKTGQPIIIADDGKMIDAQHRCWAGYLSGTPFESYVVTNVPFVKDLFAFIDNGKVRSATDALSTDGINGLSAVIAATIRIGKYYDANAFTVMKKLYVPRPTPFEVLEYVRSHPALSAAAHLQIGEYKAATTLMGYRDVAVFSAWKIMEMTDEDTLDEFMSKLGGSEPLATDDPIALLRKKFTENNDSYEPFPKHHALGYTTKVFNAVRLGEPMRKLFLKTDEKWPLFVDQSVDAEAA